MRVTCRDADMGSGDLSARGPGRYSDYILLVLRESTLAEIDLEQGKISMRVQG